MQIDIARTECRPSGYPYRHGGVFFGLAYWRSANFSFEAGQHREQGTAIMKEQLGWGHPAYLNALKQYAQFLRKSRRAERRRRWSVDSAG